MSYRQSSVTLSSLGVSMPPYDNFTQALSAGDTTSTYDFYNHGTGTPGTGIHVARWVLVFTDNTRAVLASGTYTDLSV